MRIIDNGGPYPWENLPGFLKATMSLARRDLELAPIPGKLRFFDRGLIDALAGVERSGGPRVAEQLNGWRPYDPLIFLAPPWQEIYTTNALRRHDFDEAVREFEQLAALLPSLGYCCIELPKVSAEDRADFVLGQIPGN